MFKNNILKRPLCMVFIGYITGVILQKYSINMYVVAPFIFIALFIKHSHLKFTIIACMLFTIIGCINTARVTSIKDTFMQYIADEKGEISTTVTVESINDSSEEYKTIIFKIKDYTYNNEQYKTNTKIYAIVKNDKNMTVGQSIKISSKLENLEKLRNPSGYNEEQYLKTRGISYKMFIEDIKFNGIANKIYYNLYNIKLKIQNVYSQILPSKEAGILVGMILGDTSKLEGDTRELYISSGIYHILSISGLHMSVVFICLNFILIRITGKRFAGLYSLIFLIIYCIFTGSGIPTIRAIFMISIVVIGKIFYRNRDMITSICFAALIITMYQPLYLFDVGFQISFSAVLSLFVLTYPIQRFFNLISFKNEHLYFLNSTKLNKYFYPSLSVFIGTAPVLAYHFYKISIYSAVLNILIVPTCGIIVILGFACGLLGLFNIAIAKFLIGSCFFILKTYEVVANCFIKLPYSNLVVGRPSLIQIILYYFLIFIIVYTLNNRDEKFIIYKKISYIYILIYIVINIFTKIINVNLEITMLDVGQGDSFLISKRGASFLIDGGGNIRKPMGQNIGVNTLKPFLEYEGINYIDGIFITHPDFDHAGGLIELIDIVEIGYIYLPEGLDENNKIVKLIYEKAYENNVKIIVLKKGDIVNKLNIQFEILNSKNETNSSLDNDNSLVMQLKYKKFKMLFTGDSTDKVEKLLIKEKANINADVLKIAHHGSKYSSSEEFIRQVKPKFAIISVSKYNNYGHPSKEVIEILENFNIPFYSTANNGAVKIITNGKGL